MTQGNGGGYRAGASGLIVTIPDAEPVVGKWRSRFDGSAAVGVPAHITILFPFLDLHLIDGRVKADLAALVAAHQAFQIELRECRRFPDVLYAAPVPSTGLRSLTEAIARRWPENPPYGGQFDDVIPHLTIAHVQDPQVLDMVEADVSAGLPISVRVESVDLIVYAGDRWQQEDSFRLAPAG